MFKLDLMMYEYDLLHQDGEDKLTYDGVPNKKASNNFNVCSYKTNFL